ncbi:MAG: hypothetical protein M1616_03375 [Candidatus Thermoplasmatota archaeon]|jgi:hypothetical protein|nr:hypothetical protein [Candidatus Thermoplasmatota archaeon]
MISTKASIVIGVVILVVFGSMAYLTIEKSSSGSSITASASGGYVRIVNGTGVQPLYEITSNTTQISFNFTIYTNSPVTYIYDISPLSSNHNSSLNSVNLTYLNKTEYPFNYITDNNTSNGTAVHMVLYLNSSAVKLMNTTTNPESPEVYGVEILVINGKDGSSGFGFGIIKVE